MCECVCVCVCVCVRICAVCYAVLRILYDLHDRLPRPVPLADFACPSVPRFARRARCLGCWRAAVACDTEGLLKNSQALAIDHGPLLILPLFLMLLHFTISRVPGCLCKRITSMCKMINRTDLE